MSVNNLPPLGSLPSSSPDPPIGKNSTSPAAPTSQRMMPTPSQVRPKVDSLLMKKARELERQHKLVPDQRTLERGVIRDLVAEKKEAFFTPDPLTKQSQADRAFERLRENDILVNKAVGEQFTGKEPTSEEEENTLYREKMQAFETFLREAVTTALDHFAQDTTASLTEPRFYSIPLHNSQISLIVQPGLDKEGAVDLKAYVSVGDIASGSFGAVKVVVDLSRDHMGVNAMKITSMPDLKTVDAKDKEITRQSNRKIIGQYDSVVREEAYIGKTEEKIAKALKTQEIFYTTYPHINLGDSPRPRETVSAQVIIMDYFQSSSELSLSELFYNIREDRALVIDSFYQMAVQLRDVHAENLVHRDIKPENFLFDVIPSDDEHKPPTIKIALIDGGAATTVEDLPQEKALGTLAYMAPEIIHNNLVKDGVLKEKPTPIDPSIDVWALGLTFYHLSHFTPTETEGITEAEQKDLMLQDDIHSYAPSVQDWIALLKDPPQTDKEWNLQAVTAYRHMMEGDPKPSSGDPLEQLMWEMLQPPSQRPTPQQVVERLENLRRSSQ